MKTTRVRTAGFTLTELMIVVGTIGLLASIAMPNLAKARDHSRLQVIYTNLRTLEHAKEQWAFDNHKMNGDTVASLSLLTNYFRQGGLQDVMREVYVPNPVGIPPVAQLPAGASLGPYAPGAEIPAP